MRVLEGNLVVDFSCVRTLSLVFSDEKLFEGERAGVKELTLRTNKFPSKFFNLIFAISAIVTGAVVFGVVERRSREGAVWTFVATGKLCCL